MSKKTDAVLAQEPVIVTKTPAQAVLVAMANRMVARIERLTRLNAAYKSALKNMAADLKAARDRVELLEKGMERLRTREVLRQNRSAMMAVAEGWGEK